MLENYPGSKGGSGVAEKLISLMPPHEVYVEAFVGGGAVYKLKRPAAKSYLIDANPNVAAAWHWTEGKGNTEVFNECFLSWLDRIGCKILYGCPTPLVYCDPPYLGVRNRYAVPFTEWHHARLCEWAAKAQHPIMISGYDNWLYRAYLKDFRVVTFQAMTRGGVRTEHVWCNFPAPAVLHDPRFAGGDYRERERIKKKRTRWGLRFAAMPAAERQVIAEALIGVDRDVVRAAILAATFPTAADTAGRSGGGSPSPADVPQAPSAEAPALDSPPLGAKAPRNP